jgi:hypothetical protein
MPDGDIYFHRYNHDNYGESDSDCTGWPADTVAANRYGRFWPVLSGERGEYEIANGRSASIYLKSMADAANDGYFMPEQVWDRADIACFTAGRPTGSVAEDVLAGSQRCGRLLGMQPIWRPDDHRVDLGALQHGVRVVENFDAAFGGEGFCRLRIHVGASDEAAARDRLVGVGVGARDAA